MGAKALAMEVKTDDYPKEVSDIVGKLILLKNKNEQGAPVNGQLRGWINERLTALAVLPRLNPELAEKVSKETRSKIENIEKNPNEEIGLRPEPIYI